MEPMLLDFEKPIVELDEKIADMKSLAQQSGVDVTDAIKSLEEKLETLKKETYSNLTRWQRVQLSRHQPVAAAVKWIDQTVLSLPCLAAGTHESAVPARLRGRYLGIRRARRLRLGLGPRRVRRLLAPVGLLGQLLDGF